MLAAATPAAIFCANMNTAIPTSSRLSRVVTILAIVIGTLVLNGLIVTWIWGTGVDFATQDIVLPGGSGFQIKPLPDSYRWLLGALLAANIGLLGYLLAKRKRQYALCFAVGATVPMGYLIMIVASA